MSIFLIILLSWAWYSIGVMSCVLWSIYEAKVSVHKWNFPLISLAMGLGGIFTLLVFIAEELADPCKKW
jgi:hypothetical protein